MLTKDQKRKDIADAARELFTNYGYKAVSMDSIAQKADVAKGTLYLYFKDKEALFYYLLKEFLEEFSLLLREIEDRRLNLTDEIVEVVYHLLRFRRSQKFLFRIFTEAHELNSTIAKNGVKMIDDQIAAYLKRRLAPVFEGKELNTDIIVFVIIKSYSALAFEWEESHEPLDERRISRSIGIIFRGLLTTANG